MTCWDGVATVEICHIAASVIEQLSRQRVVGDDKLGRLDPYGRLDTDGGRHGHAVGDIALGIRSER
jgi:hypothetical protein